jgi:adenylate cyclase
VSNYNDPPGIWFLCYSLGGPTWRSGRTTNNPERPRNGTAFRYRQPRSVEPDPCRNSLRRLDAVLYFQSSFAQAGDLAEPLARKAVALDPDDAEAYAVMAVVHASRGDLASELAAAEEALARNANCALALQIRGICLVCMGRAAEGCQTVLTSFRINPRDPRNRWAWEILPQAYYMLGDYPSAVETAKQAMPAHPRRLMIYCWLLAALGQLGRMDEARVVMREVAAAILPVPLDDFLQRRVPWLREVDHASMLDGLRKAGWRG